MIEQGKKYIRRADIAATGQPRQGVEPVKVLFPQLLSGEFVYEIGSGGLVRVHEDGRQNRGYDLPGDLLPWPEPPKLVPWDCLADVPLDAWFKKGNWAWVRLSQVSGSLEMFLLYGQWTNFDELFTEYMWTEDGKFKNMYPCGKTP